MLTNAPTENAPARSPPTRPAMRLTLASTDRMLRSAAAAAESSADTKRTTLASSSMESVPSVAMID
jgi:hypothetical protein